MSDPQLYSAIYATMNGKMLCQEVSITIDDKSGLLPVLTVPLGFAGVALGAGMTEFTIESATPSADFEVNPSQFLIKGVMAEFGFFMSGRTRQFKAFIIDATYSHAVNQEPKMVIKGLAPLNVWE